MYISMCIFRAQTVVATKTKNLLTGSQRLGERFVSSNKYTVSRSLHIISTTLSPTVQVQNTTQTQGKNRRSWGRTAVQTYVLVTLGHTDKACVRL